MQRRDFLRATGMCLGGVATFGMPTARFARVPGDGRLVFVLLRGGVDGLAAVAPTFDPAWRDVRRQLAGDADAMVQLADGFALTPGLAPLHEFWDRDELAVLHAMAIPYRTRSHFDGQAILETGLDAPEGSADGWLNRLLGVMEGQRAGIAIAAGMPRSLSGPNPVTSWSPTTLGVVGDAYLDRLHLLYRTDRTLSGRFESALAQHDLGVEVESMGMGGARNGGNAAALFRAAARLLTADGGPNVAAMEFSGWDTHVNQGTIGGPLDRLLGRLAEGLAVFRDAMGEEWRGTTVVVMTEFGRTARPNGSGGTDHGTAGAGFVLGSGVARRRVVADWPGLGERQLFEGRDLAPTLDVRAVLKGVLQGTFDLTAVQADRVFPGSADIRALTGMMS
ncbi:MAG: DUF1501 domain-containing protein [Gemmatimonadetes bacterium]|nr:DUF1501 domain-containing protein [Gemmatimonadota bacterium]MCA9762536.1 DUF1501 domain-containing protein [Gemmatimonadota bacterium]MCB9504635.1 DUF1501 domain-containing protein [Gemmatimonadales bacterium]HPF61103.1 DUF1501 domain-containing protein [Gemmatimonadales bacterium]HRX18733.1 DUF1501 domain-containing protein [Gemmatimonadales bacterium]